MIAATKACHICGAPVIETCHGGVCTDCHKGKSLDECRAAMARRKTNAERVKKISAGMKFMGITFAQATAMPPGVFDVLVNAHLRDYLDYRLYRERCRLPSLLRALETKRRKEAR